MISDRPISRRTVLAAVVPTALLVAGCTRTPTNGPVDPLPGEQLVFSVTLRLGLAPLVLAALQGPQLLVYGSGRMIWTESDDRAGPVPPAIRTATVDPGAVARFAAEARAGGLITADTDYGTLDVYDLPSTSVLLHDAGPATQADVYGLIEQLDDHVDWSARRRRRALRALIDRAHALTAEAASTAYVPDRVVVREIDDRYTRAAGQPWPNGVPTDFLPARTGSGTAGCGILTGPASATLYDAARLNPGQRWTVGGTTRTLAVNPLTQDARC